MGRYPELYGSDARIHVCMSELGVPLTKEPGFHQVNNSGHGKIPPLHPSSSCKHSTFHTTCTHLMTFLDFMSSEVVIFNLKRGHLRGVIDSVCTVRQGLMNVHLRAKVGLPESQHRLNNLDTYS